VLALTLALSASLAWGLSDFVAGLLGRRLGVGRVAFWSQLFGVPPLLIAVAVSGSPPPPFAEVLWGALAGLLTALGLSLLYWAMAMDMISVVAPVAALAPVIPVLTGVLLGDRLPALRWIGVASAVIGVLLLSIQRDQGKSRPVPRRSLAVAALAAASFGCWFVVMHNATNGGFSWAILIQRAISASILGIVLASQRVNARPQMRLVPALAIVGLLDLAGTALFSVSSHVGLLGVVSVLASLYPLVTIVLALSILKERVNTFQRSGMVVALVAVGCLAS
jgi:uncharacterized membrane protein